MLGLNKLKKITGSINRLLGKSLGIRFCRANGISNNKIAKKIFKDSKVVESSQGFFFLDPMPTDLELDSYYKSSYWLSRGGKSRNIEINARDLMHFEILKTLCPDMAISGNTALNFGAGHGGMSHLLWNQGLMITNVEPDGLPDFYSNRWTTVSSIREVPDSSVSLIYGSHSLEHVQNIDLMQIELVRVLKPSGVMFWEVPNAEAPGNGAQTGNVDIPHTYYFTRAFFFKWFDEVLLNASYNQNHQKWGEVQKWKEDEELCGPVIRAIGRMS